MTVGCLRLYFLLTGWFFLLINVIASSVGSGCGQLVLGNNHDNTGLHTQHMIRHRRMGRMRRRMFLFTVINLDDKDFYVGLYMIYIQSLISMR